jgi:hypothetical protein
MTSTIPTTAIAIMVLTLLVTSTGALWAKSTWMQSHIEELKLRNDIFKAVKKNLSSQRNKVIEALSSTMQYQWEWNCEVLFKEITSRNLNPPALAKAAFQRAMDYGEVAKFGFTFNVIDCDPLFAKEIVNDGYFSDYIEIMEDITRNHFLTSAIGLFKPGSEYHINQPGKWSNSDPILQLAIVGMQLKLLMGKKGIKLLQAWIIRGADEKFGH